MDVTKTKKVWNNQADEFNQWDNLSTEEQVEFASKINRELATTPDLSTKQWSYQQTTPARGKLYYNKTLDQVAIIYDESKIKLYHSRCPNTSRPLPCNYDKCIIFELAETPS